MKLIVGLGNPGRKYAGTRHNVGWEVLAELARRHGTSRPREKFHGEIVEAGIEGQGVLLLCPLTFMNRSGASVQPARDFYKLDNQDLIVVCDDFNLPLAKLRFRVRGSSGGQKGLQDIIHRLGTEEFPRLRVGIGQAPAQWDVADYVLSRFDKGDRAEMDDAIARAANSLADWVRYGTEYCMNQYNSN
jgi:PTH1 family peptidyl-tRNA hydrolase